MTFVLSCLDNAIILLGVIFSEGDPMSEIIERYTTLSVARGVGFAALAVVCFMVSFVGDTANVLRSGGLGALLIATGLFIKARNADPRYYRRTEVWIMLDEHLRPPPELAARLVTDLRRLVLLRWALRSAAVAGLLLGAALIFMLFAG
jgi:hypothetical protein